MLEKNVSVIKFVASVLRPEESMVGKIFERGTFCTGYERVTELWMVGVVMWYEQQQASQGHRWDEVDGEN